MQPMFNCFSGDTKFVTSLGVLRFNQCKDGQKLEVLDKNGIWREATVRKYGKQKLQKVTLSSGRTIKEIRCTANHRWLLKDGTVTENLKVGDRLHLLEEQNIADIKPYPFCLGFILGDGNDYNRGNSEGVRVRLCGDKTKHLKTFIECGFKISSYKESGSDDIFLTKSGTALKQRFLKSHGWKYMSKDDLISLFLGYYEADGFKNSNGIATSDDNLAQMIRDISALAGYHITSEKFEIRNTGYKKGAQLYTFCFMKSQPAKRNWIVKEIDRDDKHMYDVWCVEEPITHSFTLNGGIVTGNCCLVDIKDMLDNGTVINKRMIESPKSFQVACTVTTQIIAQVASTQYGGQSIDVRHLGKYLRRSYDRYYDLLKDTFTDPNELEEAVQKLYKKELECGVQTIQYQINTLQTTNGK